MQYACIAATETGARCRFFVEEQGTMCSHHQKMKEEGKKVEVAPTPNTVLIKLRLNKNWTKKLLLAGIDWKKGTPFRDRDRRHEVEAEKLHRKAYRYRNNIADSGVPVFGSTGISQVSISGIATTLYKKRYNVVAVHLEKGRGQGMNVLILTFRLRDRKISLSKEAIGFLNEFSSSCWGHVHIWANPPQENGKVIHTVNLAHRQPEESPKFQLIFDNGLWRAQAL